MILETTGNGPLGVAIRGAIRGMGEDVRSARVDDPDLFMTALGCRAIVCTAAPNLLDGKLEPSPLPERMRSIVKAANAPGVKLVVVVVPSGDRYADEELVLKKDGIPYVILRCPPLVEELAEATNFHVTRSLWLARGKTTAISTCADVDAAVRKALVEDSLQGATIDVPSEQVDLTEAVRRAARLAGAHTEVRATSPGLSAAFRKFAVWFGRPQPPAITLYDRMLTAAA
jgi:hypothetical protein